MRAWSHILNTCHLEQLLGATSALIFSLARCDYETFVTGPLSSKGDSACRKMAPDELFIEMEIFHR